MIVYEVTETNTTTQFATEQEAINYVQGTDLQYVSKQVVIEIPQLTTDDKLSQDIAFANKLFNAFLSENRQKEKTMSIEEEVLFIKKFVLLDVTARAGNIPVLLYLVSQAETNEIFTQERKDSFIQTINNYLNG